MIDPLQVSRFEENIGASALARGGETRWELGNVVQYNSATHTSVVQTLLGRPLLNVPQIKTGPSEFEHLPVGTTVVISWDLGFPAIIGTIDLVAQAQQGFTPPTLTGVSGVGDEDPNQLTHGTNTYKPASAPTDMSAGDWARVGRLGNYIAVLEGAVTLLGSPTAEVRSMGLAGLLQLVARRYQAFTDWGEWRTENDQGRTSFILRAGSNQATQTGMDEQHWTIRIDLGATGDVFNFQITTPQGKNLFTFHVGPNGKVQIYGEGGVDLSSGAQLAHDVIGDRTTHVEGNDATSIEGSRFNTVGASATDIINTDRKVSVGASDVSLVGLDRSTNVGRNAADTVVGNSTTDINGNNTFKMKGTFQTKAASTTVHSDGATALEGSVVSVNGTDHPLPKFDVFLGDLAQHVASLISILTPLLAPDVSPLAPLLLFAAKLGIQVPYISTKAKNG